MTSLSSNPRRVSGSTLNQLTDAVSSLESGNGTLITVTGPHGCGKTELVSDLVMSLPGFSAVRVAALSWRRDNERGVINALLDRAGSAETDLSPAFDQPGSSVVLIVDDAHWSDERSLQLLVEAVRGVCFGRIAVVLTALDSEDGVGEPSISQLRELSDLDLGMPPFGIEEITAFALSHAGVHLSSFAAQELRQLTGGRPGPIKQVLDAAPADIWRHPHPRLPIPRPWLAALERRLRPVNRDLVWRTLAAVAVMPEPFVAPSELVLELSNADRVALDAAFSAGILERIVNSREDVVAFCNPTDRAVVRAHTSPTQAAQLHRAAADYFDRLGDEDARLTHEALGSERNDADIADALAQRAESLGEAGRWRSASAAFELSARTAVDKTKAKQRHLSSVEALISASDILQAQRNITSLGHMSGDARLYSMRGYLALHEGRKSEAVGMIDLAWRTLDETSNLDPRLRTTVASRQVLLSLSEWEPEKLVSWANVTDRWAPPGSAARIESQYISMIGKAAATGQLTVDDPIPGETPILALRRDMAAGWLNLVHDDPISARQRLTRNVDVADGEGSERIRLWMEGWLARSLFLLGELSAAQRVVERGLARAERFGVRFLEPLLLWTGSQVAAFRGDHELARAYANRLTISQDSLMIQRIPSAMARLLLAGLESDSAATMRAGRTLMNMALTHDIGQPGFWLWEDVFAPTLIATGHFSEAEQIIERALERAEGSGIESVHARLAGSQGSLYLQRGDTEVGLRILDDAVEQVEALPIPVYQSRLLYEYGRILRRLGRRRRADETLARAGEIFAAMEAHEFVERCNRERRAGGLGTRTSSADGLTPQEEEIAKLVAAGASNREVATELFLSTKTVEYHLTRVYRKLGVRTRNELPGVLARR
ncbi:helix-turn-helix transcriptional regulator [Corynebacterium tapiri]|uniref:LuxR family transcriptional regulator n=1 Tax=Corynebacterium tapiri TaxID=1448266 RepID=A0A5C4U2Q2_9CORY|nr:LuxR family transcriptional regulator [Corynebacterium tapiri]TNL96676.1 LuxR family transcriptional regulator [Corynebacterium tapiri]